MNTSTRIYDPQKVFARIGGKALIKNAEGRILILRRSEKTSRPGGWDFPGGGMDFGENPVDGVKREILEETGLEVGSLTLKTTWSEVNEQGEYLVILGFEGIAPNSDVHLSLEHTEYQWLELAGVTELELPAFHRKLLETIYTI